MAGATPQSVRDMFSAELAPARPAGTVLEASDDEGLADEYRAKQPKGPFVSLPAQKRLSRGSEYCIGCHMSRSRLSSISSTAACHAD